MRKKYAVGVDVGGSHISSVLVDLSTGALLKESLSEQKVDNKASAEEILAGWSTAIGKTLDHSDRRDLEGIGFAMPGPFDYKEGIALMRHVDKYEALYGINVGVELRKLLDLPATMPFRYLNDAISFAVGECWLGKASAFKNVVAVTLGTGFGSAFLTDGIPVIEGPRVPEMGYVYHIPYEDGIADDYFSTRWFIKEYAARTGTLVNGVKAIADQALYEEHAKRLFEDFGIRIGDFLSPLLRQFDAGCLVIGGNIAAAFPLFGPAMERTLKTHQIHVEIVISDMMALAAMAGSARLLDETFWKETQALISKI
ncbi:MAG: ROK family protein [Prolixibacteraceae bacterium]